MILLAYHHVPSNWLAFQRGWWHPWAPGLIVKRPSFRFCVCCTSLITSINNQDVKETNKNIGFAFQFLNTWSNYPRRLIREAFTVKSPRLDCVDNILWEALELHNSLSLIKSVVDTKERKMRFWLSLLPLCCWYGNKMLYVSICGSDLRLRLIFLRFFHVSFLLEKFNLER